MTATAGKGRRPASIRILWATAESPELKLPDDDLHAITYRETRKESTKQLTQGGVDTFAHVLQSMKDDVNRDTRRKRTDEGGNPRTVNLQHKVYALYDMLGWSDDHRRINGFVKRMFDIGRARWLVLGQCGKAVEALKAIPEWEQRREEQHETDAR